MNWKDPDYLLNGNEIQQAAYHELNDLGIFQKLRAYDPILTGTIPIGIYLPESDLDIICCGDPEMLKPRIEDLYGSQPEFRSHIKVLRDLTTLVAGFMGTQFPIEIFIQNVPTRQQYAYLHMVKEYDILKNRGENFRAQILDLKRQGIKTEPAFARLLGIEGDPYEGLLDFQV